MPKKKTKKDENITYTLHDKNAIGQDSIDPDELLEEFNQLEMSDTDDMMDDYCLAQVNDYEMNYTNKQLMCINDYYQLGNSSKLKKMDIIDRIVTFENDKTNENVVSKRQTLWFYIQELKNDPFTKKFIWAL
jgi:hypothetical protein